MKIINMLQKMEAQRTFAGRESLATCAFNFRTFRLRTFGLFPHLAYINQDRG